MPIHKEYLFPLFNFLNEHRRIKKRTPSFWADTWKGPYFLRQGSPDTLKEEKKYREFKGWMLDNKHYGRWLSSPGALYAPREYIIPELKKILIVTPQYFGAHFFPSYQPDLISDFTYEQFKNVNKHFSHVGLKYLIAHCHGISTDFICKWSGKTEATVHKDVLESVEGFANTLPYWLWAYRVDMDAIPFTQKRNSIMKFRSRLKVWTDLNTRPQFVRPYKAKLLLPRYLQTPEALSRLPKKTNKRPIDKLLLTRPKNHTPPVIKLHRYKT